MFEPRTKDELQSVFNYFKKIDDAFWTNFAYLEKQIVTVNTPLEKPKWRSMESPYREVPGDLWRPDQPNNHKGIQYCTTITDRSYTETGLNDDSCAGFSYSVICAKPSSQYT